ncbi:hypothetical protein BHE74_00018788 [Ensete ventricosum]|nr:hypothetical protein BHE74_00018788 [Ensete ventricosum]
MRDLYWVKAQAPNEPYMAWEIVGLLELPGDSLLKVRWASLSPRQKVSYEFGYKIALTHFRTKHTGLEVEEDPYTTLPEDDNVLMEVEVPFDDSDPIAM